MREAVLREVKLWMLVAPQWKSFSKMTSSLITKSYVLISAPYDDGRMGTMSLIYEFQAFMINSCKINEIQGLSSTYLQIRHETEF